MEKTCKRCSGTTCVKNGKVRGMQRYKCKDCGYNFVEGDKRRIEGSEAMKTLCFSLYGLMKGTFRCMGELCGASHVTIYRWIRGMIEEVEIDELWHYSH